MEEMIAFFNTSGCIHHVQTGRQRHRLLRPIHNRPPPGSPAPSHTYTHSPPPTHSTTATLARENQTCVKKEKVIVKPLVTKTTPTLEYFTDRKTEANRRNAQLSTGPVSEAGKAISAQNNFRHGLTGAFCLLPDENSDEFNKLHTDLSEEHQPATATESMLVNDMARHYWLYQRALRLQEGCFAGDLTAGATQNQLNLFLRYATTHERAFHRALTDLLKLRKERLRLERGFESQARERAAEVRRESREQRLSAAEKREAEAYQREKNRPPTEFDVLNDYFREQDLQDLRERLAAATAKPEKKSGKRAA